jgi:ATP-dependent DNA helicase RecG
LKDRHNTWYQRLVVEELLRFYLQTEKVRKKVESGGHPRFPVDIRTIQYWEDLLPFCFTGDQRDVFQTLTATLKHGERIFSLLQGDVGCGKTLVALGLSLIFNKAHLQTALLCPTTVLAKQHFQTAVKLLGGMDIKVALLSSELDRSDQMRTIQALERGDIHLVIGTHRLIQADVSFASLGLIVIDEQHRFGVQQRLQLLKKGHRPHLLSMTATPIPRSLAHSVYGGYEVLQIRQRPVGQSEIHTILKKTSNRSSMIPFMKQKLRQGEQIFWVFPFIEGEDPDKQERSVEFMFRRLAGEYFPEFSQGMIHGRMNKTQMYETMDDFRSGKTQLLFATTVIEVGVDIANATIMVIEGAEHFGLSQLHQLRGRVGRGQKPGFCIVFLEDPVNPETLARARFFESCQDGFKLAEFDLKNRGAGDFFGTRQTGQSQFRFADLWLDRHCYTDMVQNLPAVLNPETMAAVQDSPLFLT